MSNESSPIYQKKKGHPPLLPPKKTKTAIVRGEQSQVPNTTLLASIILSVY